MKDRSPLIRFKCNREGAAAVEFALVAGAFFILMMGVIEYGMIMFTKVAIESATMQVARTAGIGTTSSGCDRVCTIKNTIATKTMGLVSPQSVIVTSRVVSGSTTATPPTPDICLLSSTNPFPATCPGAWQNNDGVVGYQQNTGVTAASIGTSGRLVEIRVTYLWRVLFPMFRSYFGTNGVYTITSSTVVKNEPFN
ncbi:MAG: TadE/TadG family type IV pilus assembly protein [Rickettsiales bacterium]